MRLEDCNWMDVEAYLKQDDRIMIILGACEQHGYLSLLSDAKIPAALADAAGEKSGVLVAPALNFGVSPYFLAYPGTISLRLTTFVEVVADVVRSLHGYGFRRILVLNGHGGNDPARGRLTELSNELPELQVGWYSWWVANSVLDVAHRHGLVPSHANWLENFPFTRVAEMPEGSKPIPSYKGLPGAAKSREIFGDGSFGGEYSTSPGVMDEIFAAAVQDILFLLEF